MIWGWKALESDFRRVYGMDLHRAVFVEGLTWRMFGALLEGIPLDGAYGAFLNDSGRRSLVDTSISGVVDID